MKFQADGKDGTVPTGGCVVLGPQVEDLDGDGRRDAISGSWPGELYWLRGGDGGKFAAPEKLRHPAGRAINLGSGLDTGRGGDHFVRPFARRPAESAEPKQDAPRRQPIRPPRRSAPIPPRAGGSPCSIPSARVECGSRRSWGGPLRAPRPTSSAAFARRRLDTEGGAE